MIELLDPRRIESVYPHLTAQSGWSYRLDYNWTLYQATAHGGNTILDVGCGKSPFGKYVAEKMQAQYTAIDRSTGTDFADYQTPRRFDVIMWVSSLEHNSMADMRALYLKSMYMLKPGGLFLATVVAAERTAWFNPSACTLLSATDLMQVFQEDEIIGDYGEIRKAYRADKTMMEKYKKRYGHYDDRDPLFVVAGVAKVRE